MSWNFVRFHEIQFHTEPESFSFLSWKTKNSIPKKNFLSRCQYQNKKSLFTDSIFQKVLSKTVSALRRISDLEKNVLKYTRQKFLAQTPATQKQDVHSRNPDKKLIHQT